MLKLDNGLNWNLLMNKSRMEQTKRYIECCILILLLSSIQINSQVLLQDDFQFKSNHWYWRSDGNQEIPSVNNGLLKLELQNADTAVYCNTEIYNPSEPYSVGTQVKIRLKSSPQHIGSRGWGFWDGDLDFYSMLFDFDVAWIMQQGSDINSSIYNWSLFGVDGGSLPDRETFDLKNIIDETQWHTYEIIWRADSTILIVDDVELFASTEHLPDENMRVDLWIDNRVINLTNPIEFWNDNSEGSSMTVDFIEVSGIEGPSISRLCSGNISLWESPNTYGSGKQSSLFKNYSFNSSSIGNGLLFVTGNAESYGNTENDDDLKIIFNNEDFGWNTQNSLNGNNLTGKGASIVLPVSIQLGENSLDLLTDITPFIKDVIVLFSENGEIIFNNSYNESAQNSDGLWKAINFELENTKEVTFLFSGSGYSGDKIRIEIGDKDYLWEDDYSINGDLLMGFPKTVVINEILEQGFHEINIYKIGNPNLFNIASYGANIFYLNTKIFLESCYENNNMISGISDLNDFPKFQPYSSPPWNYKGNEQIKVIPYGVIDWILIKLQNDMNFPSKSYTRAALLMDDGNIVDLDGNYVKFLGVSPGLYYITVFHRNHLSVVSNETIIVN